MVLMNKRVGIAWESGTCLGRLGDSCDHAAVVSWHTSSPSASWHSDDVDCICLQPDLVGVVPDDDCSSFILIPVSSSASSLLKRKFLHIPQAISTNYGFIFKITAFLAQ